MMKVVCSLLAAAALALTAGAVAPEKVTVNDVKNELARMPKSHPRLFLGNGGAKALVENARTSDGKALAERIMHDARLMLGYEPLPRRMDGRRLLETSRAVLYRINTLGMAYLLSGDQKYAERGIREMLSAAGYTDWNPSHFLDVGEMTLALATGYDWFYNVMTPEQRETVRKAIVEKGLNEGIRINGWWVSGDGNWTQVCHAGMVAGALAVYEDYPELAARTIQRGVVNLPKVMTKSYAPEGAYPEGPMYWGYGTEFNVVLLALLDSTLGTDFGLAAQPGFEKTLDFTVATVAPTGLPFCYADTWPGSGFDMAKVWLIRKFNRPDCFSTWYRHFFDRHVNARPQKVAFGGNRLMPLSMFFVMDYPKEGSKELPLSYYSGDKSMIPISVHRSGSDNRAVYLGMKAGYPAGPHGHMDGGSFLIEADGVRWACDLGMEDYTKQEKAKVDLWNSRQGAGRWKVFRVGPLSHNILMIDNQEQLVNGDARITEFKGAGQGQTTTIDMTPLYAKQLKSAARTGKLLPNREVVISDRLTGLKPGAKVRWQMCTQTDIAGIEGNALKLESGKETMLVTVVKPAKVSWNVVPDNKLMVPTDSANKNAKMLTFELEVPKSGNLDIEVRFTPGSVIR